MAKKKGKGEQKTFPKEQGEEGAPDRFVPPDRMDQLTHDPEDLPAVIQVKNLGENVEVVEDEEKDDEKDDDKDADELRAEDDDDEDGRQGRTRRRARTQNAGDDDGEGEGSYSRRVQRRINRERALKEQERVRAENAERRARRVEDRLAKLERVTEEVKQSGDVKALEAKIEATKNDLKKAIEDGKTAEQMDLTIKLGELQGDLKLLKHDLEAKRRQGIEDEAKRREKEEEGGGATDANAGASGGDEVTADWQQANRRWWTSPKYARQKRVAITLDTEILDEISAGVLDVAKYSDEHFEILNERLAELYPDLPLHNADGEPFKFAEEEDNVSDRDGGNGRERQSPRRPPVGGMGGRNNGRRQVNEAELARQGRVRLAEPDYNTMRLFGLDPKNAAHKKRFAQERMRTILTAERRRTGGAQ